MADVPVEQPNVELQNIINDEPQQSIKQDDNENKLDEQEHDKNVENTEEYPADNDNINQSAPDTEQNDEDITEIIYKNEINVEISNQIITNNDTNDILDENDQETQPFDQKHDENNEEAKGEITTPDIVSEEEKQLEAKQETRGKDKSLHAFSMDMASLIQVLDADIDIDNANISDLDELSEDTDAEDGHDQSEDTDESSDESDIDKLFDLADSDQLQQMMSVREDVHEENKQLWKLKSLKSAESRKNVFASLQRKQSRDPFHNALVGAVTINEQETLEMDEEDQYIKQMGTQLLEMGPPKKKEDVFDGKHILSLDTADFNEPIVDDANDVPTFATLNDGKSATIRAIDRIKQKSEKRVNYANEDNADDAAANELTLKRRIWYILRCVVIVYLYISTSFEFAYYFNKYTRNANYLILNWLCDVFMCFNIVVEYFYFRDDVIDSSTKKIIDDFNEAESRLNAMTNRKGTKGDLQNTIRAAIEELNEKGFNPEQGLVADDNHCLNKIVLKYFGNAKYESFKLYRLTHYIYFDFVINFPFDVVILIILRSWKWFIVCRLLKLLHILRLFEYFTVSFMDWIPDRGVMRSAFVSRLAKIIVIGLGWLHVWSCIWFFLGSNLFVENNGDYVGNDNEFDTWLTAYYSKLKTLNGDDFETPQYEYLWSIYFVTVTFSTVGYGDIVPMNYFEIILIIIFQLVNYVFITIFVAELAPVIEELGFRHLSRGTQHRMLRNCFESININIKEQDKLREANRYWWRNQYGMEEDEILNQLPRSLSMGVKYQFLERSLLSFIKHIIDESVANLNQSNEEEKLKKLSSLKPQDLIPHGLLRKIANQCQPRSYIRDQIILSQNVENNLLYLLIDGKVKREDEDDSLRSEDDIIANYPHFFGQESFWRSKTKSKYTYTAKTMVCVFVISSKQIRNILKPYPEISAFFARIFKKAYPTFSKQNDAETLRRKPALQLLTENEIKLQEFKYKIYRYTALIWDILNAFCIVTQCYIFMWAISFFLMPAFNFNKTPYKGPLIVNWLIDALFLLDIILSAFPNITKMVYFYPARSQTQMQTQDRKYILDILAVIPFELILIPFAWKTTYIYLLRSFKWLRIRYLEYCWTSWVELIRSIHIASKFTKNVVYIVSIVHCFACLWYLIGTVSFVRNDNLNWIVNDPTIQEADDSVSLSRSLLRSYYFVLVTETTIGYGGIVPFSLSEMVWGVILVILGSILYWISISFFAISASYQQFSRIDHTNLVTATEFLLTKQLSTSALDKNDELMVRLQHYFDFVLQQREGAVSFWDEQKPSLQTLLRYQLLTTAFNTKKVNDPQKYRFLEWIPNEIMFEFSKHLTWIVICKGQQIKIKQSGNDSFVLFLITGTLWSPYSNYIFSRHAKSENNTDIVTFNLASLAPINMKITRDAAAVELDAMQMLSTYLQIDVNPKQYKKLHKLIYGVYEITDAQRIGLQNANRSDIIYQLIPPDQEQYDTDKMKEHEIFAELEEKKLLDGTFTFLMYETTVDDLHTITEDAQNEKKQDVDVNHGKWTFLSMERKDGILDTNSRKEFAFYELISDEKAMDPKYADCEHWKLANDKNRSITITIGDELQFEALETCDVVQLFQKDVLDSFEEKYPIRFTKYLDKATKTDKRGSVLIKRGSILSPQSAAANTRTSQKNSNAVANMIMNDQKFAFNNKKQRTSVRLLPQFKEKRKSVQGSDLLLRQATSLFLNDGSNTQHLHFKEVMKRYHTDLENEDLNTENAAWLEQAESIAFYDDKYRILKILWYFTGISFIAILQFVLPMRAVFKSDVPFMYFSFDIITQIYFMIDLFVQWNLFKKQAKEQGWSSQGRLLKILDYILVIPWDFCGLLFSWRMYYLFRLFDLFRITRLKHYWNDMRHELVHYTGKIISVHAGLSAIIFHIFALFLIASYCACLWYIIGVIEQRNDNFAWIDGADESNYYTLSVYWSMASMSSVGYGDLKPISFAETLFALFALPFMVGFYIRFMGDMASFAGNIERSTKTAFYEKFSHTLLALNRRIEHLELFAIGEAKQLLDLKKKIRKYLSFLWKERAGMSESEIYSKLPYFLTRDISFQCRKKFLSSIPCLKEIIKSKKNLQLIKTIAFKLQHHIITRNEELPLDQIFVVEKGDIIIIDNKSHKQVNIHNDEDEEDDADIDNEHDAKSEEEDENIMSKLFTKINATTMHLTHSQHSSKFEAYLAPKPTNKNNVTQHKLQCISNFASLYSLPYESLLDIQIGYEENKTDGNYKILQDILKNYWSDSHDAHNGYDDDKYDDFEYNPKSIRTLKLASGDEKEDINITKSKYLLDGETDFADFYYLLYHPSRKIFRPSHGVRLSWDLFCCLCLFFYAVLLPLQFSNIFYTEQSMIYALILSFFIDIIFFIHFLFRSFIFASHPIKKFNPFYVMIGTYNNEKLKEKYKNKLADKLKIGSGAENQHLLYRDLPKKQSDIRPFYELILEILAMLPLNALGLIPSLYSTVNMNFYFRLNKVIYLFLLFDYANRSLNTFILKFKIYFFTARIFRICLLMVCVLHWMSCIWFQFAEFEHADSETKKTWLTEMDTKKLNISQWADNPFYAYLLSLYFVVITMTTTGYGDITAVTKSEINMTNVLIILGDTLMALMAGIFIQYISNINQPSLEIVIKERSFTHYLQHRMAEIMSRSKQMVKKKEMPLIFNAKTVSKQKEAFKKLNKKIDRYFQMQLDYQDRVSTISSLTQHLPLYYRMKLLHTLFESLFKGYPFLYENKNFYFRLLDNVKEEIYTFWDDNLFEFIVDPQQTKIVDFMIVQFGQCCVYSSKQWHRMQTQTKKRLPRKYNYKLKKEGDLIGFRSLVLQNSHNLDEKIKRKLLKKEKPKCVITPFPNEKNEKFKIVSVLKISQNDWRQIINDVFTTYEQKIQFEQWVQIHIKPDIED